MERSEKIGLAVAAVGHAALFGLLSLDFLSRDEAETAKPKAIEISLVDKVALEATAPPAAEPPAQSRAPEPAPPEEAAPPEPAPEPRPEPKPAPAKPPEPAPAAKPAPKAPPPPKKPPAAKPDTPTKLKTVPVKAAAAPTRPATAAKGTGTNAAAKKLRAGGFVLDPETLNGKSATPTKAKVPSPAAPGATMNAQAQANIASAILRQVQPCADRQVNPASGQADRIRVTIRLSLNQDGSMAARPQIVAHDGIDDDNRRYIDAVDRLAIATFNGCAPLRGLPPELYDVPRGWKTFSLRYKLPD